MIFWLSCNTYRAPFVLCSAVCWNSLQRVVPSFLVRTAGLLLWSLGRCCCLSFCLRVSVPVHPMNLCVVFVPWSFSYNLDNCIRQHTGMFSLAPTHCDKIWRAKNMLAAKCQTQVYNEVSLKISSSHQCELCTHKDSLCTVIMAQLVNAYWQTVPRAHKGLALISPRDVLRV